MQQIKQRCCTRIQLLYAETRTRIVPNLYRYTTFLLHLSAALHKKGRKLSACVGSYPTAEGGISVFYDPAVINATCNVVRVMNYDMYYVGGRGVQSLKSRPDCAGVGPTSTVPWAKFSMEWWSARVSVDKLVMGLPAYSNDYSALPHFGGSNGTQQGVGPPNEGAEALKGSVESTWEFFDQIYVHHYSDATVQGNPPRIRYGTDARSTKSQLKTADALGIKQVGFWTWNSASAEMMDTLYNWTAAKEFPTPPSVVASAATPALMPFDILPANASLPPVHRNSDMVSWGIAVGKEGGKYHAFLDVLVGGCSLAYWQSNSQIMHMTADAPEGPFTMKEPVLPVFTSNPSLTRAPDGTWLLFSIGLGNVTGVVPAQCSSDATGANSSADTGSSGYGVDGYTGNITTLHYSRSLNGPWKVLQVPAASSGPFATTTAILPGFTNPSAMALPNGTIVVVGIPQGCCTDGYVRSVLLSRLERRHSQWLMSVPSTPLSFTF